MTMMKLCAHVHAFLLLVLFTLIDGSNGLNNKIPVFFDSTNHWHRDMQYHPEQGARIERCVAAINERIPDHVELFDVATDADNQVQSPRLWPFSEKELNHARDMLIKAHSEELVTGLEKRCRDSRQRRVDEGKPPLGFVGHIDDDTFLTTESYDVCLRAAAAWIRAVDESTKNPTSAAFALTRPPGHHATTTLSNGFCLFNFAAAAAIHLMESNSTLKVSILDWDVHYGQGVADIMERYDRARYVSLHQTPAFPYMGNKKQTQGVHSNVLTIPIQMESSWTCGYKDVFFNDALPFVHTTGSWEPDIVIICAGYDALSSDQLASVDLNADDYGRMIDGLQNHLVGSKCRGIALGLEGGYQLADAGGAGNLPDAVVATIESLYKNAAD